MKLEFTILGNLPSANIYFRGSTWRKKYGRQKKEKESWFWAIKEGLQKVGFHYVGNTSYFNTKVKIDLAVYGSDRRSEKDRSNLIATADKLIVDNLVQMRVLVDDSPEFLEWGQIEQKVGRPPRVKVKLYECY